MPMSTVIILVAIGVAYVAFSTFAQRKVGNPKKMRELQQRMKTLSSELNALIKQNAPKEEINKKQSELMPLMSENMKTSIKPMLIILPIFFLLYYLALPTAFHSIANEYVPFLFSMKLNYAGVFFACVFILGIISSIVIMVYDKKKAKLERIAEQASDAAQA
ncbi:EMC3/TMCO1 family protein [Candidatus Marsarchaeota archaeon]|nr:EMC3/TMCO1 family protein [Candidatus Marsarchaeota archaeon]